MSQSRLRSFLALLLVAALPVACVEPARPSYPAAQADDDAYDVAIEDFYEALSPHGTWVDSPYGRAWQPGEQYVGADFFPYASHGQWVADEDGSWSFQSNYDEQWGWAVYHYGRWDLHDAYGWIWIPGAEWAPAWVEWRHGGGYIGWAPLAPEGVAYGEERWVFVEEPRFAEPQIMVYRLDVERVRTVFGVAVRLLDVRGRRGGRGRWYVGPRIARLRAAGVNVRTVRVRPPRRGYVKARARGPGYVKRAPRANRPPAVRRTPARPAVQRRPDDVAPRPEPRIDPPAPRPEPRIEHHAPKPAPKAERHGPKPDRNVQPRVEPKPARKQSPKVEPRKPPKLERKAEPKKPPKVERKAEPKPARKVESKKKKKK